jgi:triphosphatase
MQETTPHKELEVKLELSPARAGELKKSRLFRSLRARPRRSTEVSVYFDTNKHRLHKQGVMLRVRRTRGRYVQTIKANGNAAPFERDEWETEVPTKNPNLDLANGTALAPLLDKKLRRQLKPLFETRVRRTIYPIRNNKRAIELTIDRGTIDTGTCSAPLCEIELELKRGSVADVIELARELTRTLPARLAVKSKSERGYELLNGGPDTPVKAAPVDLSAVANTRDAFQIIARACLKQVIANEPALLKGDPEGVHQMRVGLRRMRAAMSLFSNLMHDAQSAAIKAELKWLTGELGPAREFEVLVSRVVAPVRARRHAQWGGMPALSREITDKREAALARAQDAVTSARFRALTLELAAWIEAGQWRTPQDDLVRDRGSLPISVSAAEELTRRWRKVRKKGKALAKLDAPARHKLRIQAKKLRYGAEFFASLFTQKRAAKRHQQFLARLECLQDALGDLNDIAVHEERITAIAMDHPRANPQRAFAAGLLSGREDARIEETMAEAQEAYAALAKVKPFWR